MGVFCAGVGYILNAYMIKIDEIIETIALLEIDQETIFASVKININ